MRRIRRARTLTKLMQRKRLMEAIGLRGGTIYQKHREKVEYSLGYMRTGNVSHYVSTHMRKKARSRSRYGRVFLPAKRDQIRLDLMNDQLVTGEYPFLEDYE